MQKRNFNLQTIGPVYVLVASPDPSDGFQDIEIPDDMLQRHEQAWTMWKQSQQELAQLMPTEQYTWPEIPMNSLKKT